MENTIKDGTDYTEDIYQKFKDKMDKPQPSSIEKIYEEIKLQKMTKDEKNAYLFQKKEKEQEEKIKEINMKIDKIQKIKNKVGVDNDYYNSMKSLSDGQTLAVSNLENGLYNIHINDKCLGIKDDKLNLAKCSANGNMNFEISNITNMEDYNKHIKDKNLYVDENSGLFYPFDLIKYDDKCLGLNGNNIYLDDCVDNKNQRYRGSKIRKDCKRFSNL